MKYMLDTNIIAYAKNHRPEVVFHRFQDHLKDGLGISSITLAELEYGVCNSSDPDRNRLALAAFLSGIEVAPFDAEAARQYGSIRSYLRKAGMPIGANDLLIASHAKALDVILVTNNTREFARVEGLRLENWA